jgi:hypothetical protein
MSQRTFTRINNVNSCLYCTTIIKNCKKKKNLTAWHGGSCCNLGTREAEAGGSQVRGHPRLKG